MSDWSLGKRREEVEGFDIDDDERKNEWGVVVYILLLHEWNALGREGGLIYTDRNSNKKAQSLL